MKKRKTRASSTDRIQGCNASSQKPEMVIDESGDEARFGNCMHEILHNVVKNNMDTLPDISPFMSRHGCLEFRSMRIACYMGLNTWKEVRSELNLDTLFTEERMIEELDSENDLSGKGDWGAMMNDGDTLFIADWKSFHMRSHLNQLLTYAYLGFKRFPQAKKVWVAAYYCRDNHQTITEYTREYVEGEWAASMVEAINGDTYNPNDENCQYCPVYDCEAKARLNRATVRSLVNIKDELSVPIAMMEQYENVQMMEKTINKFKAQVKDHIKANGPMKLPSGKYLNLIEGHTSKTYLFPAIELLQKEFGFELETVDLIEFLKDIITISKTDLMEFVRAKADKGMIGKDKKRVSEALDDCRASVRTYFDKMIVQWDCPKELLAEVTQKEVAELLDGDSKSEDQFKAEYLNKPAVEKS